MQNKRAVLNYGSLFLYNENHAIVAWFKRGYADGQTANKKKTQKFCMNGSLREGAVESERD